MEKKITKEVVEYLGSLARIHLADGEKKQLEKDIGKTLEYVSQLNSVDTEGVSPTYHTLPIANVFREDKVEKNLPGKEVLKNAPEKVNDFFKVPKII